MSSGTEVKQWIFVEVRLQIRSDKYSLLWTEGINRQCFLLSPVFRRWKLLHKFVKVGCWRVRLLRVGRLHYVHTFIPFLQINRRYCKWIRMGGRRRLVIGLVHTFLSFKNDGSGVVYIRYYFMRFLVLLFQTLRVVRSWVAASTRVLTCTITPFPLLNNIRYWIDDFLACAKERASALAIEVEVENGGVILVYRGLKLV